jgi:glycosyltransferase involved in cell wall biosynthesis
MSNVKILHVTAFYPPHLGGQEVAVRDLVERLTVAHREVEVVTSDLGSVRGTRVENGIRVTHLKSHEFAHTAVIWSLPFWLLKNVRRDTLLHLHTGQVFTPEVVWLAAKLVGFKYIIHFHADFTPSSSLGGLLRLYKRLLLNRAVRDAVATVLINDDHAEEILREYSGVKNVRVISNAIRDDFFEVPRHPTSGTLRLLFVGRLGPHKNVASLLEALELVDQDIELDIVGDGEYRQQLEDLAASKKLANVTFHGKLTRDEIKSFYSTCGALVLPSTVEPQGIVLLEAMACRTPVIATKMSGLVQTIDGAGILIDPTVQGIANGITTFAAMNASEVDLMTAEAFRRARQLSWSTLLKTYLDLYEAVAPRLVEGNRVEKAKVQSS